MRTEAEKRKIRLYFGGLAVIALLINSYFFAPAKSHPSSAETLVQRNGPSDHAKTGTINLNDYEWQGITCLEPSGHIEFKILTSNVWWQIRCDKDDKRVYTLHPANWNTSDNLDIKEPATVIEWRILPGQSSKEGIVAWSITALQ